MKTSPPKNYLIIAPENTDRSGLFRNYIGMLSEELIKDHWVYVAEEHRKEIEDTASGVRYLGWDISLLKHFGSLEGIIVVNDDSLAEQLHHDFAQKAPVISWHPLERTIEVQNANEKTALPIIDRFSSLMKCSVNSSTGESETTDKSLPRKESKIAA